MNNASTRTSPLHLSPETAAALDHLLHAMGQPLSILQACALVRLRPLSSLDQAEAFAADMAGEVDRLTLLYRSLRHLVEHILNPPEESGLENTAPEESTTS